MKDPLVRIRFTARNIPVTTCRGEPQQCQLCHHNIDIGQPYHNAPVGVVAHARCVQQVLERNRLLNHVGWTARQPFGG